MMYRIGSSHNFPRGITLTLSAASKPAPLERRLGQSTALGLVLASLIACLATPALAQTFPTKRVRIIVPAGPSGAVDLVPRLLAERMAPDLGQPIIIENRPGGAGIPAVNEILNSPADGYTVLTAYAANWAITPALQPVPYDFLRDFAPVGLSFTGLRVYAVLSSTPVKSLQDLIALAKEKPGSINYASAGVGSGVHMEAAVFASSLGLVTRHIPYRGGAEEVEALLRGDVQYTMSGVNVIMPHVKAGKVRLLAVNRKARSAIVPELPTVAEITGLRDFDFATYVGWVVRAGTPKPVIDRLSGALMKAGAQPDLVAKVFSSGGVELTPSTPEQLAEIIRNEITQYTQAVKTLKVVP